MPRVSIVPRRPGRRGHRRSESMRCSKATGIRGPARSSTATRRSSARRAQRRPFCRFVEDRPNRAVIEAGVDSGRRLSAPARFISSDWRVTVDGLDSAAARANHLLLPGGAAAQGHRRVVVYRPRALLRGATSSSWQASSFCGPPYAADDCSRPRMRPGSESARPLSTPLVSAAMVPLGRRHRPTELPRM